MARLINPAFNLAAFADPDDVPAQPPAMNTLYLRKGEYDGMSRADVAASFAAYAQGTQERLALFFHGGLVDKASGAKGAAHQYERFKDVCFPYFFVWESGFFEILANDLPGIFGDSLFGAIFHHARDSVLAKLAMSSGPSVRSFLIDEAAAPGALEDVTPTNEQRRTFTMTHDDLDAFSKALTADAAFRSGVETVARNPSNQPESAREMLLATTPSTKRTDNHRLNPAMVGTIVGAYRGATRSASSALQPMALTPDAGGLMNAMTSFAHALWAVLVNVARRITAGRDHGVTCTIVEEILRVAYLSNFGSSMWEEMKDETRAAFGADSSRFGGRAVIEEVCALVKARPSMPVTLIGHSTGGVYIGNFLTEIDAALRLQGDMSFQFDVLLMAPANTMSFFSQTYNARVRALRWFSMSDAAEQQDLLICSDIGTSPNAPLYGRVYPRSLLYLISGALETFATNVSSNPPHDLDTSDMPLFGMDRFFPTDPPFSDEEYPEIGKARQYLSRPPNFSRVLSPTSASAPDGQRCGSQKHGDFPADPQMCGSIEFCLRNGIR